MPVVSTKACVKPITDRRYESSNLACRVDTHVLPWERFRVGGGKLTLTTPGNELLQGTTSIIVRPCP
jgi:hypothetical protein